MSARLSSGEPVRVRVQPDVVRLPVDVDLHSEEQQAARNEGDPERA